MGGDFAFVGRQYPIRIEDDEYFVDLLFYHRKLNSLVAIELKAGKFTPQDVGQMSMYLAGLDEYEKTKGENPAIGIILCKEKSRKSVELLLKYIAKPIGVASYKTYEDREDLPDKVKKYLPSVAELKERLEVLMIG